jgi:subfamily B ATP-binding cassette protein HlyB/CyaB
MVKQISKEAFFWILQRLCALHRKPLPLAPVQEGTTYSPEALLRAARLFGFNAASRMCKVGRLRKQAFPLIAWQRARQEKALPECLRPVLLLQADAQNVLMLTPGDAVPNTVPLVEFARCFSGAITAIRLAESYLAVVPAVQPQLPEQAIAA